jgi:NAD(P)-dependent dehydrogenase (short-subunit alcohol dehydrogenase family)
MILEKFSLKGRAAVVTGASRGIGKAMSLALAEAGADVAVAARTLLKLEDVCEKIHSLGRNCVACQTDVTRSEDIANLVQKTLHKLGKIDILVNNAGMNVRKLAIDLSEPEWDRILDTNLKAYFFCSQAVAKEMAKSKRGTIINIASVRSLIAPPMASAYTASKGRGLSVDESAGGRMGAARNPGECHRPRVHGDGINRAFQREGNRPVRGNS